MPGTHTIACEAAFCSCFGRQRVENARFSTPTYGESCTDHVGTGGTPVSFVGTIARTITHLRIEEDLKSFMACRTNEKVFKLPPPYPPATVLRQAFRALVGHGRSSVNKLSAPPFCVHGDCTTVSRLPKKLCKPVSEISNDPCCVRGSRRPR